MKPLPPSLSPAEAVSLVSNGMTVAMSGFTGAGSIKACGRALAERARAEHAAGRPFAIRLMTGASTGPAVDGALAAADAIAFRCPYQSDPHERRQINSGTLPFFDLHLSHVTQFLEYGFLGEIDIAFVEASAVTREGHVYLTTSSGASATFLARAKRVVIELNSYHDSRVGDLHDNFSPPAPPNRREIPIHHPLDRIGTPYAPVNPAKIIGIVANDEPDETGAPTPSSPEHEAIGLHVADFLAAEMKAGRIPREFLPLQAGIGNVANAVMATLGRDTRLPAFTMFTEVVMDSMIGLIDEGRLLGASTSALTLSRPMLERVYADFDRYEPKLVIRPQSVSNHPEVIRRLGVISINTALEADIYGNVNSTHVCGTDLMNGIGGSGDFTRNAYISIFLVPSTAKGGAISAIVPMVSHTDHNEHSVQVVVSEHGLADLRGVVPADRADRIIERCAHPGYRPMLRDYVKSARPGHIRHDLRHAFDMHLRYLETGTMRG